MKPRVVSLVVLLLAVLISGCSQSGREQHIGFIDLVSDAQKYHAKNVCTTGVHASGFEVNALAASTYEKDGAVYLAEPVAWLEGADVRSRSDCFTPDTAPQATFCRVAVCGRFEAAGGYGHLGAYDFQIRGRTR